MRLTRRFSLRYQALTIIAFILLSAGTSLCQKAARPDRGTMPNRSYSLSDIETISLQNGNVNLSIPLASLPPIAGGNLSWTIGANYNSKLWNVLRAQGEYTDDLEWNPFVVDMPGVDGGWTIGGRYAMFLRNSNEDFSRLFYPASSGLSASERTLLNNFSYWKAVLRMPDGSEHEFRPVDHSPYAGQQDFLRGYFTVLPNGSPVRYYSVDGTFMFAKISSEFDWTVYLPDGTRIIQTPDGIQRLQDTNGNKIKIFTDANGDHYVDEQSNREIRVTFDPAANGGQGQTRVWYPTVTGTQHHIDINYGTTSVQGKTYLVEDWLPFGGEEGGTFCQHTELLSMNLRVVREIVLPQTEPGQPQRRFTFSYNSDTTESTSNPVNWSCNGGFENYSRQASRGWGELSRMVTPSGSIVDYSYLLDSEHALLGSADDLSYQSITKKKLTHDGTFDEWNYAVSEIVSQASMTSPDGRHVTEQKHCTTAGCSTGKAGLVYRTTVPFTMTERHWTNLTFTGANTASPGGILTFNAVVDFEYTTLLDASNNPLKMSAKAFQYDFNGNLTQTTEYDWFDHNLVSRDALGVPTGVPASAAVLRITNNTHYNQASSASSANVYAKRSVSTGAPLILNATQQTTSGPRNVQFSYDGQAYGTAPTAGNLTTRKIWDNIDSKWITTSNTYDTYGNVATSTDGRGKVMQFFYEDATHALPTRVVVDPQNGTGPQTTYTSYDSSTGLITSRTDVNGQVTSIDYTNQLLNAIDPFGRPGITKKPSINISGTNHRHRTTTTYVDSARQVIVANDLNTENDKLLKTRTTVDMLGRPILNESTEDGTNYSISSRSAYLNMGQVTLTSSPMRSTAAATDSWKRVTKDGAGRITDIATFGGAAQPAWSGTAGAFTGAVTTSYTANFATVTDQAGKVRRSMSDALGRMLRVDEPDASGNLGSTTSPVQPTSYTYDVSDNLSSVTQGSRTRTFTHDSLSRLRTAINPESGTVSYQYDDNGNLVVRTDARTDPLDLNKKVSTHYEYDSLNRLTRRWYNGSSSVSATTHNSPSLPSGVGATNEARFFYDSQALPGGAPSYSRGSAVGRLVAQIHGSGSNGDYYAYDVLGQPSLKIQQIGAVNYQLSAGYILSGAVRSLTYPSGRTITNTYDLAGRLSSFSGTLGDGVSRTYSTPLVYSPLQSVLKEQFGTNTPVYHKVHYNSRAQICDIRASASNDEWGGELGAFVNHYTTWWAHCGNGPDNNGNVLMSQTIINSVFFEDRYSYDSLNRLTAVSEYRNGVTLTGTQEYDYDRWGNRTIKPTSTLGSNKQFTVTANNRLAVPGGQPGVMSYDQAGNLTNDTYTGAGNRTFDAENRMTSAWGGNNQAQLYTYNANGQRTKRTVDGVETWHVYGLEDELLAEYAANSTPSNPQKEYGYRNGQLLITGEASTTFATNVALASNGATATASSTWTNAPFSYPASAAINGDRKGLAAGYAQNWTSNGTSLPQSVEVTFNGSKTINEISVFSLQDNYQNPVEPTEATTFSLYGLTAFDVQYWNGSSWVTVPGGSVTGNNKVWKKITFAPLTTTKIRVLITATSDGWSRIVELEVWTTGAPKPNVASSANGATAAASSTWTNAPFSYPASAAINGDRKGLAAGYAQNWTSNGTSLPQSVEVTFNGSKTINEISVFSLQDNYQNPVEPTEAATFSLYGLTAFDVQYWNGSSWVTVPGGSVTGNNKVWKKITFAPLTTTKIRVLITATSDGWSRIVELEAWQAATAGAGVNWLVSDHLGTPRMIIDQTGSLANVKRHDYLPFGEEIFVGTGGRTAALGYSGGDGVRQQFTSKERDFETGLDFFEARYYSSVMGRFTSVDPGNAGARKADPQSWNGYSYALNNPLRFIDPSGLTTIYCAQGGKAVSCAYLYEQLRQGNFEVVTFTSSTGASITVRKSDFNKPGPSFERADGTLVTTTEFDQTAFLAAAANLVRLAQATESRDTEAPIPGFGGGGDFAGGGAGGCWCDGAGAMRRLRYVGASYHRQTKSGRKSPAPVNGQDALDYSVQVKETGPRRVGIDYATGQFVVFDQHVPGEFHGHVRTWQELEPDQRNALISTGNVNRRGKIIGGRGDNN